MKLRFDWKFGITTFIALAGLALTWYVLQTDLGAHSLTIRLVSSSALQPSKSAQFKDLQITLNGLPIQSPYLSSFELKNTGSKPILSGDFEGPIRIFSNSEERFISAQLDGTDPNNIPVTITNSDDSVRISPFLFNPKDAVTFSIITSGNSPHFSVQSRIAGVKEILFEDSSVKKGNLTTLVFSGVSAAISLLLYVGYLAFAALKPKVIITRPVVILTGLSCGIAAAYLATKASAELALLTPYAVEIQTITGAIFFLSLLIGSCYFAYKRARKNYALSK